MLKLFCLFCFVSILFYFLFFKNMILLCFQYFFIYLFVWFLFRFLLFRSSFSYENDGPPY